MNWKNFFWQNRLDSALQDVLTHTMWSTLMLVSVAAGVSIGATKTPIESAVFITGLTVAGGSLFIVAFLLSIFTLSNLLFDVIASIGSEKDKPDAYLKSENS